MPDETHRPDLRSWVESANAPGCDFPIQNLPFGVFRSSRTGERPRVGMAIGDHVLDLVVCHQQRVFEGDAREAVQACLTPPLNALMALGRGPSAALRRQASALLAAGGAAQPRAEALRDRLLVPMSDTHMVLPAAIGDYTDFYASIHHATNVGRLFRPDNPLLPNYKWVPIGYHGRASSIVVSGTSVRRPGGQIKDAQHDAPVFAPTRALDYEAEVGLFVTGGNELGDPVALREAASHMFGLCLVNDWSARDIQSWEYQPLGPFLAKSFATTISPWVVTMEALEPFRVVRAPRAEGDPVPLPYLEDESDRARGAIDMTIDVLLQSPRMRETGAAPTRVSRGNLRGLYWTFAQMLTHHTSNGCNLRPGDLLASGTVSGEGEDARGCLLELTSRGAHPLRLPTGEERRFLEDGDEVIMRARCERDGFVPIGFGECRASVVSPGAGVR